MSPFTPSISLIDLAKSTDSLFGGSSITLHQSTITFTTSESFLLLPRWNSGVNMSLSIRFRTTEANGVLFYSNGIKNFNSFSPGKDDLNKYQNDSDDDDDDDDDKIQKVTSRDFFALELLDGLLYTVLNMGTGAIKVKSTIKRIDTGHWYDLTVNLTGRTGEIIVNGRHVSFVAPPDSSLQYSVDSIPHLDLEGPVYLGSLGSPAIVTRTTGRSSSSSIHFTNLLSPPELWSGSLGYGFVGCVSHLSLNEQSIDLLKYTQEQDSLGIERGCNDPSLNYCSSESCVNNATCINGWNRAICSCDQLGLTGVNCAREALIVSLQSGQFIRLNFASKSITQAEDISLRFRTTSSDGLLMLAVDIDDDEDYDEKLVNFLAIIIESSRLKIIINLGEGNKITYISTNFSETLADDTWHWLKIERRGPSLEIILDNVNLITELTGQANTLIINTFYFGSLYERNINKKSNDFKMINNYSSNLFISIIHPIIRETLSNVPGFTGLLQSIIFNKIDLLESSRNRQLNGLFNSTGEFHFNPVRLTSSMINNSRSYHHSVTFKSKNTYVKLAGLKAFSQMKLHFYFKTLSNNGLLLYNQGKVHNHFIGIELENGQLVYAFNLGDGGRKLISSSSSSSSNKLNDNEWHSVTIIRSINNLHTLTVDESIVSLESPGINVHVALNSIAYLGGVPSHMYKSSSIDALPKLLNSRHGYQGCLAFIEFNGQLIDPIIQSDSVLSLSTLVSGGCQTFTSSNDEQFCTLYSCSNRGTCITLPSPRKLLDFPSSSSPRAILNVTTTSACDCDESTFLSSTCTIDGLAVRFTQANTDEVNSNSIITYVIKESNQLDHKEDTISFGLITSQLNAVIIRIDSSTIDFIEVQLVNGTIVIIYNLGYEDHEITNEQVRVDDNKYHFIRFNRTGPNSTLEIDQHNIIEKIPSGKQLELFDVMGKIQIGGKRTLSTPFPPITLSFGIDASKISNATRKLPNFNGVIIGLNLNGDNLFDLTTSAFNSESNSGFTSTSSIASFVSTSHGDIVIKKEGKVDFLTNIPRLFNPNNVRHFFHFNTTTSSLPSFTSIDKNDSLDHISSSYPHHHHHSEETSDTSDNVKVSISSNHLTHYNGQRSDISFKDELILSENSFSCWSDYDCIDFSLSPSSSSSPSTILPPLSTLNRPSSGQFTTAIDLLPDDLITPIFTSTISTFQNESMSLPSSSSPVVLNSHKIADKTFSSSLITTPRPCADEDDEDCYEEIGSGQLTGDDDVEPEEENVHNESRKKVSHFNSHEYTSTVDENDYISTSTSTTVRLKEAEVYEFKPWPTVTTTNIQFTSPSVVTMSPFVFSTFTPSTVNSRVYSTIINFPPRVITSTTEASVTTAINSIREIEQTYRPKYPMFISPPTRISSVSPSSTINTSPSTSKVNIIDVPKPPDKKITSKLFNNNHISKSNAFQGTNKNSSVKSMSGSSSTATATTNGSGVSSSVDRTALVIGIIATIIIIIVFVAPIILFTKIRMNDPSMASDFSFTHTSLPSHEVTYVTSGRNTLQPSKSVHLIATPTVQQQSTTGHVGTSSNVSIVQYPVHLTNSTNCSDIKYHQLNQPYQQNVPPTGYVPPMNTYLTYQQSSGNVMNGPTSILKKKQCCSSKNEFEWFV